MTIVQKGLTQQTRFAQNQSVTKIFKTGPWSVPGRWPVNILEIFFCLIRASLDIWTLGHAWLFIPAMWCRANYHFLCLELWRMMYQFDTEMWGCSILCNWPLIKTLRTKAVWAPLVGNTSRVLLQVITGSINLSPYGEHKWKDSTLHIYSFCCL